MAGLIKTLPARLPEIGRLRMGEKGAKGEPVRLNTWRFTSRDEVVVKAFASRHGGDVEPWEEGQFQVVSESTELEVFLPPDPLMSAFERWGSGGCTRRCDGETADVVVTGPDGGHIEPQECVCIASGWTPGDAWDVEKNGACDVYVRLRVVDPYAPGAGVYLLTSGSIYAAMELPGQVALLTSMADRGTFIPCTLALEHRKEKKPWEKFTREFNVPVLRVRASMAQLASYDGDDMRRRLAAEPVAPLPAAEPRSIEAPSTPALPAAEPAKAAPAKAPAKAPAAKQTAGARPAPFPKTVRQAATRADLSEDELSVLVKQVTGLEGADDLQTPELGNAVLDALKKVKDGTWPITYSNDGVVHFEIPAEQGTLN